MAGCFFVKKRGFLFLSSSIHSSSQIGENELNLRPLCTYLRISTLWNSFIHSLHCVLSERKNRNNGWGSFFVKLLNLFFFLHAFIHKMSSISINVQFSDKHIYQVANCRKMGRFRRHLCAFLEKFHLVEFIHSCILKGSIAFFVDSLNCHVIRYIKKKLPEFSS